MKRQKQQNHPESANMLILKHHEDDFKTNKQYLCWLLYKM